MRRIGVSLSRWRLSCFLSGRHRFGAHKVIRSMAFSDRVRLGFMGLGFALSGFFAGSCRAAEVGDWIFLGGKTGFELRESRWTEAFLREADPGIADRILWGVQPYVTATEQAEWEKRFFRSPAVVGAARVVWFLGAEESSETVFDGEKSSRRWSAFLEKWKTVRGDRGAEDVVIGPPRMEGNEDLDRRRAEVSSVLKGVVEGVGLKYVDLGQLMRDVAGNREVATALLPRGEVSEGGSAYWTGRGFLTGEGHRLVAKRLVTALTGHRFLSSSKAQALREGMSRGVYDAGGLVRFVETRAPFTGLIGEGLFEGRGLPDLGDGAVLREKVTFAAAQGKSGGDGAFMRRHDAASGLRVSVLATSVRFPALDGAYRFVRDASGKWSFLVRGQDGEVRLVSLVDRGNGGALDEGRIVSKRVEEPAGIWADGESVVLAERGGFFRYTVRGGDFEEGRREPLAIGEGWRWRGDDAGGRPLIQRENGGFPGWIYGTKGSRIASGFLRFSVAGLTSVPMVPRLVEGDARLRLMADGFGNVVTYGDGDDSIRFGSRGLGNSSGGEEKGGRAFSSLRKLPPAIALARWEHGGGVSPVPSPRWLVAGWGEVNGVWSVELRDVSGVAGVGGVDRILNWGDRGYRPADMGTDADGALVVLLSRKETLAEMPPGDDDAHTLLVRVAGAGKGGKRRSGVDARWGVVGEADGGEGWEALAEGEVLERMWLYGGKIGERKGMVEKVLGAKDFRVRSGLARWVGERVLAGEWDAQIAARLAADPSEFVRQEAFEMALRMPAARVREAVGLMEALMGVGTQDGFRAEVYPEWRKRQRDGDRWKVPADAELRRYVFGRTSDTDLERMEAGLSVYEEAVARLGVSEGFRRKGFVEIARARGTFFSEEVMKVVGERVAKGEAAMRFQARLLDMIGERDVRELEAVRGLVTRFTEASLPEVRRAAFGVLISAEGVGAVWRRVQGSLSKEEEVLGVFAGRQSPDWAERGRDWVVSELGSGVLTKERARKLFGVLARTNGRFGRLNAPVFLREVMGKKPLREAVEALEAIPRGDRSGVLQLGDLVRYARAWKAEGESEESRRGRRLVALMAKESDGVEATAIAEYLTR